MFHCRQKFFEDSPRVHQNCARARGEDVMLARVASVEKISVSVHGVNKKQHASASDGMGPLKPSQERSGSPKTVRD
jgi:hypothetical protein